jgi:hypothetical protein
MAEDTVARLRRAGRRAVSLTAGVVGRALPVARWIVRQGAAGARAVAERWQSRPGERLRRLRQRASVPLPNLYEVHPDVRRATPREIGLRSIDLDDIVGTAVAGPAQRGSDFLPLPPFRSRNWQSRWQRILKAIESLAILPPIDLVRYAGKYWVLDGHNRVAAAHYVGQVEIDANVTELVPPGQNPSERPSNLAAALTGTTAVRAAGRGERLRTMRDDEVPAVRPGDFDGRVTPPPTPASPAPSTPTATPEPEPAEGDEEAAPAES